MIKHIYNLEKVEILINKYLKIFRKFINKAKAQALLNKINWLKFKQLSKNMNQNKFKILNNYNNKL
jgi:hypothetical protein